MIENRKPLFEPDRQPWRMVKSSRALEPLGIEIPPKTREAGRLRSGLYGAGLLLTMAALFAAWRLASLQQYARPEALLGWAEAIGNSPAAPAIIIGIFVAGGLLMVPVTALILATAIIEGPVTGSVYTMAGVLVSATVLYWLGVVVGHEVVEKLLGERFRRVSEQVARHGIVMVAVLRVVPVAPFTMINLAAGVTGVRFRDFIIGTIIGMTPGVVVINLFGDRLAKAIRDPDPVNIAILLVALAAVAAGSLAANRLFNRTWT